MTVMNPSGQTLRPNGTLAQARVLFALMLREMTTRFGRSAGGYLWALLEPVGFIALLAFVFSQIAHSPPVGRSFALFYATGYIGFSFYNDIASLTGRAVQVNRPLLNYPAVTALDAVLARFLLQVLTGLAVAVVIFCGILAVFAEHVRIDLVPLAIAAALAALLGLGVGLLNTSLFALSKTWERIYGVISRPLFLVSAVFFSFGSLPGAVREVLWWNPLIHLVGLVRAGFYPIYDASYVSVLYVASLGLGLVAGGLALMLTCANRLASE